jgi:hypothetical protein
MATAAGQTCFRCRILQREGERDLFALRQPARASDDDDDDAEDRYDIEMDSSDETQGAGAAGRQSGAMSEYYKAFLRTISYLMLHLTSRRLSEVLGSSHP